MRTDLHRHSFSLYLLFFLLFTTAFTFDASAQKKKIRLKSAKSLEYNPKISAAQRLIGNVVFEHENTVMYCDSAYFYENTNAIDAFGHINIRQGDTLNLYGDFLKYNGDQRKAELLKNVRIVKKDMTLTTDHLFYDMNTQVANYAGGGKIINKDNTLTSENGYYYAKFNELNFKKNVVLTNPRYVMNCDTLRYNTVSKTAYFLGPSTIRSNENIIY